jgi:hypothetical protein
MGMELEEEFRKFSGRALLGQMNKGDPIAILQLLNSCNS